MLDNELLTSSSSSSIKQINFQGTTTRYKMKNVLKIINIPKKRIEPIKWNLTENQYSYQTQLKIINNYFYNQSNLTEKNNLTEELKILQYMQQQIKQKCSSYKTQDKKKGKYNSSSFINEDDILNTMYKTKLICFYCQNPIMILYENVRDAGQWTVDRIDNELGHNKNNYVLSCLKCNLQKRKRNSDDFEFTKQMHLIRTGYIKTIDNDNIEDI